MHETRTIANWVANLRYEDIPEDVREHARRFILDNFGCQIAGATLPWSKTYYDMMCATRSGSHSMWRSMATAWRRTMPPS